MQKNYLRSRNQAKEISQASKLHNADSEKLYKLIAAQAKAEEELKVLRDENEMLKKQNTDLAGQYRD